MICLHNVAKAYRPAGSVLGRRRTVSALRGVSLEVGRGQIVGLVGPNGAGKTTLLEILATILLPDGGRATVGGRDVVREAAEVRRLVAYCPSTLHSFYPRLSGFQNLEFFAAVHGVVGRSARETIGHALEAVDVAGAADARVQTYSDGMRQRLAFARALVTGARVLLLDEPTKSLDFAARAAVHRLLRRMLIDRLGLTVLLVTHSAHEAVEICDRVAVLERGRIVDAGLPGAVVKVS